MRMRRASKVTFAAVLALAVPAAEAQECAGKLYLTIDTGSMKPAKEIQAILRKHQVRATFFIANERTWRGDTALEAAWAPYWKSLAEDGHAFGTHTWRHWYFSADGPDKVLYVNRGKTREWLNQDQFCRELGRVGEVFQQMTGTKMQPIWRAPGGQLTSRTQQFAKSCGYEHIGWSPAGFLGDELPSSTHPNRVLLRKALTNLKGGDILMMHLGIRSRTDPFWPMLDPLLAGLKKKGFCFATFGEGARQ